MREAHLLCCLGSREEGVGRVGVLIGDWIICMRLKDGMRTGLATAVLDLFIEYLIEVGVLPLCSRD